MKKYEFTAGTAKTDMIMGLSYPAVFGFPILAVRLALFYLKLDKILKSYPLLFYLLMFSAIYISYLFIKKIRESLTKNFIVELDEKNIKIWKDGDEVMSGRVSFCRINHKPDRIASYLRVDIRTDTDKISFRSRTKEYKTITGSSSFNPFGTGNLSDMETLLSLGERISGTIGGREVE